MRAHLIATASIGLSVMLLAAGGVAAGEYGTSPLLSSAARAPLTPMTILRGATSPFAPPPPLRFDTAAPLPFLDVTGSIAPADPHPAAPTTPAMASVSPDAATIVLPPPDAPPPVAIDTTQPASGGPVAVALGTALNTFTGPAGRRPGETLFEARQRAKDRAAIAAFYAARANAPLWLDGDHVSAPTRSALSRVDRGGEDGLNLSAYAVSPVSDPTPEKLAQFDLAVSEAVVAYARQASGGRINPLQIDPLITAKPTATDPAAVLAAVAGAGDASAFLQAYNPPQPGYAALRAKLAELRQQDAPMAHETIPAGPTLKLGMRDPRVPLIRSRFGLDLPSASADDGLVYDTKVAAAVAEFQRSAGLPASGALTTRTIAALSGGNPTRLENELVANMERWRWLPREPEPTHIDVNIPDYSLDVITDGAVVHHARVVVGKPDHQTPVFSDTMRFIIVNPYWNVPLSIIKKEMLPKLAADPNYFANHGYEVVERDGVMMVRQPPGEDNALGRVKFMFPNQHSVYLHDTNARALFGRDKRAFSHGCVRVDQPFKLAEVVLAGKGNWTEKRVEKLVGGSERSITLPTPLPIHLNYFTAFVDGSGQLQLRDDLYGYSGKVKLALGLRD